MNTKMIHFRFNEPHGTIRISLINVLKTATIHTFKFQMPVEIDIKDIIGGF